MHQSIPAAPSPAPGATEGHLPAFKSGPVVGHLQIFYCPETGHLLTPGPTPSFWHSRGFLSKYKYLEDFTEKNKQIGSSVKDGKKLKRFVKAFSPFYAYISSLLIKPELHRGKWPLSKVRVAKSEAIDVNQRFFCIFWIKFLLLLLFEDHPFIYIKLFITAHY